MFTLKDFIPSFFTARREQARQKKWLKRKLMEKMLISSQERRWLKSKQKQNAARKARLKKRRHQKRFNLPRG